MAESFASHACSIMSGCGQYFSVPECGSARCDKFLSKKHRFVHASIER